jgi:hypothetical protein
MPPYRVLLVLLAAALAGCLGGGRGPPVAATPTDAAGLLSFSPELYLPGGERFAEPGIQVAPDGTIYVTAPGAREPGPVPGVATFGDTIWRSDDGGQSFRRLPLPDSGFGGGDSDLAVASDGTLYQSGLWAGCVSLSVSHDKGETWQTNPLACGYAAAADDRNWLATHGAQTVYLTFGWAANPAGEGRIALVKTLVQGRAVTTTTSSFEDTYQWPGNVAVDQASGAVFVAYNTVEDAIVVLRSRDGGMTLEKRLVSQRPGDTFDSFGVVAVGRDGAVYVTWSERDRPDGTKPDRTDVFYSHSSDEGETWSAPTKVNSFAGTHIYPWLDAGSAGHVVVAWYGTDAVGDTAEKVNGTWNVYLAESHSADQPEPGWVESIVSTKPISTGGICTSGTGCAPGTRALLDYFQVALDAEERPHLAWATRGWQADPTPTTPVALAYAKQLTP